jgi:hypothetical protein
MKENIITMIKEMVGHEYLYFSTSLLVKITPHTWPVQMWAVSVSPSDEIFLMDGFEAWHKLEETDRNYSLILSTLNQRIQMIYKQVKTVA